MVGISGKILSNNVPQVTAEIRRRIIKIANETAYEAAEIAKGLCPVDTGFLRESIRVEQTGGNRLKVVVDAEYAAAVEYGTSKSEAQPFLRPALEAVRGRLNRRLGQVIKGLGKQV